MDGTPGSTDAAMLHMHERRLTGTIASFVTAAAVTIAATAAGAASASPAAIGKGTDAETGAGAPRSELSITIYTDDLALVQDRRTVNLTGGRQRLEFENVSAQIRSDTVSLAARNLTIIEQNFDYDLLTPERLLWEAVGHEVTIVKTNSSSGAETRDRVLVLAFNGGLVFKSGEKLDVLHDDGLPARVILDRVPDNLRAHPTLSVPVNGAHRGAEPVVLSYLTPGLGWRADYVAFYDASNSKIDVQGWLTLTNTSGTTYENAETLLVAGSPSDTTGEDIPHLPFNPWPSRTALREAGTEAGTRGRLGDDYLYPLAERTTIADQQTKQLTFLDVHGVPAEHGYEFRNGWLQESSKPSSAQATYCLSTTAHGGVGDQLPAGTLRMYVRDKEGEPQFIGESRIESTPMGSTLSLTTGEAFDVKVKPTVVARTKRPVGWNTDMSYELTNALPVPVSVLLQQDVGLHRRIVTESQVSHRLNDYTIEWTVAMPANGSAQVTASFEDL